MISSNEFSDFVDQINDGELDDDSFMATYSHGQSSPEDDERYLKNLFMKYSEQAWDEKGN